MPLEVLEAQEHFLILQLGQLETQVQLGLHVQLDRVRTRELDLLQQGQQDQILEQLRLQEAQDLLVLYALVLAALGLHLAA